MVFLLAVSAKAAGAPAEDSESLIRQGVELRHKGEDLRAEGYFRRAYSLAKTPRSAAQLGLVELALGAFADSNAHLTEALASDDLWIQRQRSVLEQSREHARSHLARIEIVGAPVGATVRVGTGAPVAIPVEGILWVVPAAVSLVIEAPRHIPVTSNVSLSEGSSTRLVVELPAMPAMATDSTANGVHSSQPRAETAATAVVLQASPREPERSPEPGRSARILGISIAGAGVIASATGLILYRMATTKRDAVATALNNPAAQYSDSDMNWKTYDRLGVGFMVGGAAAAASGFALYLFGRHQGVVGSESHVSLSVIPAPGAIQVGGRF